ncbi:hypothetical protein MS5797_54840 [Klebsiella pneumoniae]|nr:hypothetical protein MS5797_54840 [Klebsiella pneumoniae]
MVIEMGILNPKTKRVFFDKYLYPDNLTIYLLDIKPIAVITVEIHNMIIIP